jgi:hypothetical protein
MKTIVTTLWLVAGSLITFAQDTIQYKLRLRMPLVDFPQNVSLPYQYPSLRQSLEIANNFYELGFWGIDELGNTVFRRRTTKNKWFNRAFTFALGLGFSKYGSELPIPLGVWAHEEFHRSVLGISKVASKNGNWLFNRWDGTVYGVSDHSLSHLKATDLHQLLYSYTAGVHSEILLNEQTSIRDFYKRRSLAKNALLLYNAHYVYAYFRFSASPASDSVKVLAPSHEHRNPAERDYAGSDLTAWAYDMFNPAAPYAERDTFPGGEGVNRRIGFADLSPEARAYLVTQRNLSLLNFLNPAIFFINRIRLNPMLSFNFFARYAPTHFGNDIAVFLPVQYRKYDLLMAVHRYSNRSSDGYGLDLGIHNYRVLPRLAVDIQLHVWNQPRSFYEAGHRNGGALELTGNYLTSNQFSTFVSLIGKTEGWLIGDPYLNRNLSVQAGVAYVLPR